MLSLESAVQLKPSLCYNGAKMKIDFTSKVYDIDGKPFEKADATGTAIPGTSQTFQDLLPGMLLGQPCETGEDHVKVFDWAMTVKCATGPIEMTAEAIVFVKQRVVKVTTPMFYGRLNELLEGKKPVGVAP